MICSPKSQLAAIGCVPRKRPRLRRRGKVVVFLLVALPSILGIVGLVFDAGMMLDGRLELRHASDAAATAAAMELLLGKSSAEATSTAEAYVHDMNKMPQAAVAVSIPPESGPYAGDDGYVEVTSTLPFRTRLIHLVGAARDQTLEARAVAGFAAATDGAAIVVLDPDPAPVSVAGVPPVLPALPAIVGGLEVLGVGSVRVDGAVLVNTTWGGRDQDGNPAGEAPGPPYGVSCTPLLSLTRLDARDIRVVGGVDNPNNYGPFESGGDPPLQANRLPVPDPFEGLPAPTVGADATNVNTTLRGAVNVVGLPLLGPPTVLQPGIYDSLAVLSGRVVFNPGVYVIRGVNPVTQIALNLTGGEITANGVMFYITDSAGYDAASGLPDSDDGETTPGDHDYTGLAPSVVINAGLLNSSFSSLNDTSSPFHRMLIYQRRHDYRPIAIVHQGLIGGNAISGTVYAKWGHVILIGTSTYDMRLVAGTVRLLAVGNLTIVPSQLLPPAQDVFLVE